MAWTKLKTAAVMAVGLLLAAGSATVVVKAVHYRANYNWQVPNVSSQVLDDAPSQVKILPSKFPRGGGSVMTTTAFGDDRFLGIGQSVHDMMLWVYGGGTYRTVVTAKLPGGKFDYIANLRTGSREALEAAIKKQFGVTGRKEERESDVLYLKTSTPNAPGLVHSTAKYGTSRSGKGTFTCVHQPLEIINSYLENYFKTPVIDQTHVTGSFDINLTWNETGSPDDKETLKQAVLDQLGLELEPGRQNIEMLIIEPAR